MRGSSIPQLIMYHRTATGWKRESLVGAQDPAAIESFINRGLDGLKVPASALGTPASAAAKSGNSCSSWADGDTERSRNTQNHKACAFRSF